MRVSRRVDYGVRTMLDLALAQPGELVQARELAHRQGIPDKYLEQLLRDLKNAGLVVAVRGSRGGHALAVPAAQISILDIVQAVEGPLAVEEDEPGPPGSASPTVGTVWQSLLDTVRDELSARDLASLAHAHREQQDQGASWVI